MHCPYSTAYRIIFILALLLFILLWSTFFSKGESFTLRECSTVHRICDRQWDHLHRNVYIYHLKFKSLLGIHSDRVWLCIFTGVCVPICLMYVSFYMYIPMPKDARPISWNTPVVPPQVCGSNPVWGRISGCGQKKSPSLAQPGSGVFSTGKPVASS